MKWSNFFVFVCLVYGQIIAYYFPFCGELKVEDDAIKKKWIVGVKCDVC